MDISIIIPTYNRLWCLPKAIESCRKNKNPNIEIIVVDDGSTDGTWEYLKSQTDVISIKQENWGKPWAVNLAFSISKGKYIKFLDSDDWLVEYSLDDQFMLGEKEQADVIVAGYHVYEHNKLTRSQNWVLCDDFIAQQLGECDSSHYSAFLFRREFIKDIPHRTSFAPSVFASRDDRCFMLEVAFKEPRISISPSPTLCHLHHEKSRLQFQQNMSNICTNFQHLLIYKNIIRKLQNNNKINLRRTTAAINVLWPLSHWIAKTDIQEAAGVVEWIYQLNPGFKIPEKGLLGLLYKNLGFRRTERLLKIRREFKF